MRRRRPQPIKNSVLDTSTTYTLILAITCVFLSLKIPFWQNIPKSTPLFNIRLKILFPKFIEEHISYRSTEICIRFHSYSTLFLGYAYVGAGMIRMLLLFLVSTMQNQRNIQHTRGRCWTKTKKFTSNNESAWWIIMANHTHQRSFNKSKLRWESNKCNLKHEGIGIIKYSWGWYKFFYYRTSIAITIHCTIYSLQNETY